MAITLMPIMNVGGMQLFKISSNENAEKILLKSNKLFRKKTSMYIMDINRSIDVDSKFDLTIIKKLLK